VPIVGSDMMFPVRRIDCIGRNYRAHSIEMGSNPDREPPFFFQKPTDAIQNCAPGSVVERALEHVYAYALGLPQTTRPARRAGLFHGRAAAFRTRPCRPG